MTAEKSFLLGLDRVQGLNNDDEIRRFAKALSRKRSRFAFPDDFVACVSKLLKRWSDKHKKDSSEGSSLRSIDEIRVSAYPSWNDSNVNVVFLFITNQSSIDETLEKQVEEWLKLLSSSERYTFSGECTSLDIMTAREYTDSDPLDLDNLTISQEMSDEV